MRHYFRKDQQGVGGSLIPLERHYLPCFKVSYRKEESCRDGKFFAAGITELERRASD